MQMHIVLNQEDREVKFSSDVFFFLFQCHFNDVCLDAFYELPCY